MKRCEHIKKKFFFYRILLSARKFCQTDFKGGNQAILTVQMFSPISKKQLLGVPASRKPFRQNVSSCQSCVNILNTLPAFLTGVKIPYLPQKGSQLSFPDACLHLFSWWQKIQLSHCDKNIFLNTIRTNISCSEEDSSETIIIEWLLIFGAQK